MVSDLSALSLLCTLPAAAPSDSHQPPRRSQLMQLSQNLGHMVGLAYVSVALIVFQTAAIACAAGSQCAGRVHSRQFTQERAGLDVKGGIRTH